MTPKQLSYIVQSRIQDAEERLDEIRIFYGGMHGMNQEFGESLILGFEKALGVADVALDIMAERGYWEPMGRPGIDGLIEDLDVYTVKHNMEHVRAMRRELEMILEGAMKLSRSVFYEDEPWARKKKETMKRGYETYQAGKHRRKDRSYNYD